MTVELDVVVVGSGVAGLAAAHDLARSGLSVLVCETGDEVGGLLGRGTLGGVEIDLGAESFATRTTAVADLIADAGLDLRIVEPRPGGAHLVAATPEGPVVAPLPRRTVLGIPGRPDADDVVAIIGADAAARALAERDLPAHTGAEPSLAELVAERCGPILAARLVEPLCRSVYSQSPADVTLSRLHPALWREFLARGSLIAAAEATASGTRAGAAVAGISGGMWRLAAELRRVAEARGAQVLTRTAVHALAPGGSGVDVHTAAGAIRARRVVLAVGARAADRLMPGAPAGPGFDGPPAGVTVAAALVTHPALDAHPVGSGVIVDPALETTAKALTHVSAKWEWVSAAYPTGTHVVRLSARQHDGPGLTTRADIAAQLARLTGVPITVSDVRDLIVRRWTDAVIPAAGADSAARAGRAREASRAGIHQAGAAVAGTGLASVIPHARALATELSETLSAPVRRSIA